MNEQPVATRSRAILKLSGVSVERDGTQILDAVDWSVAAGENWVIFGPNGAGKTTLLNVITGYLWPTAGDIAVLGEHFGSVDLRELRREVSLVSDSLRFVINPSLTGFECLVTGARAHLNIFQAPTRRERARAKQIARSAQIEPLLEKPFGVMSTGERQRVLIARAMMSRPRLAIFDEPCAGLDLAGREMVLHTIASVASQPAAPAILFTTHHVEEIMPAFTHALLLNAGRVLAGGPLAQTLTSKNLTTMFGMQFRLDHRDGRWAARALFASNK